MDRDSAEIKYRLVLKPGDADPKALAACSVMDNKWPERLPDDLESFKKELEALDVESHFLVAAHSGMELVGFSRFQIMEHDGKWWCMGLHVEPEWRRRGIGTGLLKEGFAHCAAIGVGEIRSCTSPDNSASRATHEKAGFVYDGEKGYNYYGEWRDKGCFFRWHRENS